jgi:2-isopropylmalate synthase
MRIFTFDTTLRDGTQGEAVSLSADDKVLIAHKLDELGIDISRAAGRLESEGQRFARAKEIPVPARAADGLRA